MVKSIWCQSFSHVFPTFCGVVMPPTGGLGQGTGQGQRDFKGRYLRNSLGGSMGYGYSVIWWDAITILYNYYKLYIYINIYIIRYIYIYIYPPTPAFAKAGAAPGTTAGVELVFLSNRHPKATSMAFYGRPRLPFASPKTLQTPKTPQRHFHGFLWASSAGKSPHPWLFMGVQACRLPVLKPSKPSKPLKPRKGHFNGFL